MYLPKIFVLLHKSLAITYNNWTAHDKLVSFEKNAN